MVTTNYQKGVEAEKLAQNFLTSQGFTLLFKRYKSKFGEIDLIAEQNKRIHFIEVKYRKNHDEAIFSVAKRQYQRITNAANFFISEFPQYNDYDLSFDLLVVDHYTRVYHYDNYWFSDEVI